MMDCRQAQSLVALAVGQDDSDSCSAVVLERHVQQCPACQRFHQELQISQTALSEARLLPESPRRIWPQVAARLADMERRPQFARFNVWVPTALATAACGLLVSVALLEMRQDGGGIAGLVWQQPEPRDLFRSDPAFNANRGELPTDADFERWLSKSKSELPAEFRGLELQPANSPIPHGSRFR